MRRRDRALLVILALTAFGFEWEGRLGRLERELASAPPGRRQEVVRLLAAYPAAEVADALLQALQDEDAGVRSAAAEAAGRVRLRQAVPALLAWLADPDADVRAAAARALGRIAEASAVPSLVRTLGDADPLVRVAAVDALENLGRASGGDESVVPLLGRLEDDDPRVRSRAARALASLGDPRALVPLIGRGRDEAPEVRAVVYGALGRLGDRRATPALVQGLRDGNEEARLAAVGALGRMADPRAREPLLELVEDGDARVVRAAIAALGELPGETVVLALIGLLPRHPIPAGDALLQRPLPASGDDPVAVLLARRCRDLAGRNEAPMNATVLARRLLQRPQPSVGEDLREALRRARPSELPALLSALARSGDEEAGVLLLDRVARTTGTAQAAALEALGEHFDRVPPDGRAADPLLTVLGEVSAAQRASVVTLLGRVGASRALPALRPLLESRDPTLRRAAVRAIGRIGDPEGAEALLPLLEADDAEVRFEAALALGGSGDAATLDRLVAMLQTRTSTDRPAVLLAMEGVVARLPEEADLAATEAMLLTVVGSGDERLAERAIAVLAVHPSFETALRERALARTKLGTRRAAVRGMAGARSDASRAALRSLLAEPLVAPEAAFALGEATRRGGSAEDVEALLGATERIAWPAGPAATFALARIARLPAGAARDALAARGESLCALLALRDAAARSNVLVALTALGRRCPERSASSFVVEGHAPAVRAAAHRWWAATEPGSEARQASVEACLREALDGSVATACASPELPPLDSEADVYAYGIDGRTVLRHRLVALHLADGTILVARTNASGRLVLGDVPRGPLRLDDPLRTPLEP